MRCACAWSAHDFERAVQRQRSAESQGISRRGFASARDSQLRVLSDRVRVRVAGRASAALCFSRQPGRAGFQGRRRRRRRATSAGADNPGQHAQLSRGGIEHAARLVAHPRSEFDRARAGVGRREARGSGAIVGAATLGQSASSPLNYCVPCETHSSAISAASFGVYTGTLECCADFT